MKTYPMVAIATLGVWMAGSASVQAESLIELTAPAAIQDVALVGSAVDRHPPVATQYAGLTRDGVDRHPPVATQYAGLTRYGVDRHPPLATQYAELTGQEPIQMVLRLGKGNDEFALTPKTLTFEKGKHYRLLIVNPSRVIHYISAPKFGAAIGSENLTRGVVLRPSDEHLWNFVADKEGTYDIRCLQAGHAKNGMVGKIIVS